MIRLYNNYDSKMALLNLYVNLALYFDAPQFLYLCYTINQQQVVSFIEFIIERDFKRLLRATVCVSLIQKRAPLRLQKLLNAKLALYNK